MTTAGVGAGCGSRSADIASAGTAGQSQNRYDVRPADPNQIEIHCRHPRCVWSGLLPGVDDRLITAMPAILANGHFSRALKKKFTKIGGGSAPGPGLSPGVTAIRYQQRLWGMGLEFRTVTSATTDRCGHEDRTALAGAWGRKVGGDCDACGRDGCHRDAGCCGNPDHPGFDHVLSAAYRAEQGRFGERLQARIDDHTQQVAAGPDGFDRGPRAHEHDFGIARSAKSINSRSRCPASPTTA